MPIATCPNREELSGLLLGNLPADSAAELETHVDSCPQCQTAIISLNDSSDWIAAALKQVTGSLPPMDDHCRELLNRIRQLEPSVVSVHDDAIPPAEPEQDFGSIGFYKLLAKLGEGGMGAVYKAQHTRLRRTVAVKVLPADRVQSPEAIARFDREMQAVGALDHVNIVRAFDAGDHDGRHYIAMEYVKGRDLSQIAKAAGPLPIADACEIIRQAAVGLQHAHEAGLVHRDIKPGNLMLTESGVVKVLDLGLARLGQASGVGELTTTGQVMGTLDYMAPEQGGDTHHVDIRADIYSLGASLYRLLTGEAPFGDAKYDSPVKKLMALAITEPAPVQSRRPDVPPDLAAIVHKMLAKTSEQRYSTPAAVEAALAPFCVGANLKALAAIDSPFSLAPVLRGEGRGEGPAETIDTAPHLSSAMTGTLALGNPAVDQSALTQAAPPKFSAKPPIWRRPWAIAAACGGAAILLFAIWIIIRDKDGNVVAKIKQPGGGTTTVQEERDNAPDSNTHAKISEVKPDSSSAAPPSTPPQFALDFNHPAETGNARVELPALLRPFEPCTVEMYVTARSASDTWDNRGVFIVGGGVQLRQQKNNWDWYVYIPGKVETYDRVLVAGGVMLGRRMHLAGVSTGKELRLYVDGHFAGKTPILGDLGVAAAPCLLGGLAASFDAWKPFDGLIDEVKISKTARYDENFTPAMRFEAHADTLALYHFDEGQGEVLKDSSGNNHHGKIVGAKWVKIDGSAANAAPPPAISSSPVPHESRQFKPNEPHSPQALVKQPAPIEGVKSWTVEPLRPRYPVQALDLSSQNVLAAAGKDACVQLIDASDGRLLGMIALSATLSHAHDYDGQNAIAFSPDGHLLALATMNGRVEVWDVATRRRLRTFQHDELVPSLGWSPDSKSLACVAGGMLHLWNMAEPQARQIPLGVRAIALATAWSPEQDQIAVALFGEQQGLIVCNLKTGKLDLQVFADNRVSQVAWSPDGTRLAASGFLAHPNSEIRLYEVANGGFDSLTSGTGYCGLNLWFRDQTVVFTDFLSEEFMLIEHDLKSKQQQTWKLGRLAGFVHSSDIALARDMRLAASCTWATRLALWKRSDRGSEYQPIDMESAAFTDPSHRDARFPDGVHVRARTSDDEFGILPLDSPVIEQVFTGRIGWSHDCTRMIQAEGKEAIVWNATNGKVLHRLKREKPVSLACLSPDGKLAATADDDGVVVTWNTETGEDLVAPATTAGVKRFLSWLPDGSSLAVGGPGGMELLDPNSGKRLDLFDFKIAAPPDAKPWRSHAWLSSARRASEGPALNPKAAPNSETTSVPRLRVGLLALRCVDGIRVFDIEKQAELHAIKEASPLGRFSHDGEHFLWTDASGVNKQAEIRTGQVSDLAIGIQLDSLPTGLPSVPVSAWLAVGPEGHYRASGDVASDIVYIVETDKGQETLSPAEFEQRFNWKNDPSKVAPFDLDLPKNEPGPKPEVTKIEIEPEPFEFEKGAPISPEALVAKPAELKGLASWTIDTLPGRESVFQVAYSPDGKWLLATASDVGREGYTLTLWDAKWRVPTRRIHTRVSPHLVSWSPDSRYFATGNEPFGIYEAATGRLVRSLAMDGRRGHRVRWSPVSGLLACNYFPSRNLVLRDTVTGGVVDVIERPVEQMDGPQWSPDGKQILMATHFDFVGPNYVWEVAARRIVQVVQSGSAAGFAYGWSGDKIVTTANLHDMGLRIWSGGLTHPSARLAGKGEFLRVSPDGKQVVQQLGDTAGYEVLTFAAPERLQLLTGDDVARFFCIPDWSPDGRIIAANSTSGDMHFWRPHAKEPLEVVKGVARHNGYFGGSFAIWSTDARRVVPQGAIHAEVFPLTWGVLPGSEVSISVASRGLAAYPHGNHADVFADAKGPYWRLEVSPDRSRVAVGNGTREVVRAEIWNFDTKQLEHEFTIDGGFNQGLRWSPSSGQLAVSAGDRIRMYDTTTGKHILDLPAKAGEGVGRVRFSADGKRLAVLCGEGLLVYEWREAKLIARVALDAVQNCDVVWQGDKSIAAVCADNQVRVVDVDDRKVNRAFTFVGSIAQFNADSTRLMTTDGNYCVRTYDVATGKLLETILYLRDDNWLVVSPEGHYRCSEGAKQWLCFVALTDNGSQLTLSPAEFEQKYGWKNDPEKIQLAE